VQIVIASSFRFDRIALALPGYDTAFSVSTEACQSDNLYLRNEPSVLAVSNDRVTRQGTRYANRPVRGVDSFMPSKLQRTIGNAIRLQFVGYHVIENNRPAWLESPEGERLELDFYLPELRVAFEVQGQQHYRFTPKFHKTPNQFNSQVRRDAAKRRLCQEFKVELFEVASLDDFEFLRDRLNSIIRSHKSLLLEQHILRKVAQELINNGGLQRRAGALREHVQKAKKQRDVRFYQRTLKQCLFHLEMSNERLRTLSLKAINDFEGRHVPTGVARYYQKFNAVRRAKTGGIR